MSHKIHTKQKIYGMGDDPMVGKDYCEGELPDEKIEEPVTKDMIPEYPA